MVSITRKGRSQRIHMFIDDPLMILQVLSIRTVNYLMVERNPREKKRVIKFWIPFPHMSGRKLQQHYNKLFSTTTYNARDPGSPKQTTMRFGSGWLDTLNHHSLTIWRLMLRGCFQGAFIFEKNRSSDLPACKVGDSKKVTCHTTISHTRSAAIPCSPTMKGIPAKIACW